jgi:hypothetical protein
MSYRILYITPHLSTGGCPQYLLKKIQLLNNDNEIYCVEYHDYGEWFTVQKNQVRELLKDRYYALKEDKREILNIINKIDPQVIHIEEMPEYFMGDDIADEIYKPERTYNIVETSHDSSFNPATKRHFPDRFVFVSEYQRQNVVSLKIPSEVVEYPIPFKSRLNRTEQLTEFGLDPNLFHVVNVGLFSPRKNQSEIMEYARKMTHLPIQFHFVGNLAGNFQHYWDPLLKDVPSNCKIWGERSDVDKFFGCMDLFLFTSRGHANDKETSPIVIREAISYNIPSLIYNLPVYLGMYNKYKNVKYLTENFDENVKLIESYIPKQHKCEKPYCYVVSSYPYTDLMEKTTVNCIRSLNNSHTILTTHYKDHEKFKSIAGEVIFDESNPIIKHTFYEWYWAKYHEFDLDLRLNCADNDNYHGLAVWTNYQNGIRRSKELGYKYSVCMNYDLVINEKDLAVIENIVSSLESSKKKGYFMYEKAQEGDTLKTIFCVIDNDYFIEKFKSVRTDQEYSDDLHRVDSPSNGLENYVYNVLKNNLGDIIVSNESERTLFTNSEVNLFSCVEYSSVLPVANENKFVVWKNNEHIVDNKHVVVDVYENGTLLSKIGFLQTCRTHVNTIFDIKPDSKYDVIFQEYNVNLERVSSKTVSFKNKSDLMLHGEYRVTNLSVKNDIKKTSRLNVHHFSTVEQSTDFVSSLPGVIYRQYNTLTDVDVFSLLKYSPNETHLILKNVTSNLSPEEFIKVVKDARDYMYDNNLPIYSFGTSLDGAFFGNAKHATGYKLADTDAYLINNDYLQSLSEVKISDSMSLFNNYLSKQKKGFSTSFDVITL